MHNYVAIHTYGLKFTVFQKNLSGVTVIPFRDYFKDIKITGFDGVVL